MTQNAFLSSKLKVHLFFAGQPGSSTISILSKSIYIKTFYPLTFSTGIISNFGKMPYFWVFSEELRIWCSIKIMHKIISGWYKAVNNTQLNPDQDVLNIPGHLKTRTVIKGYRRDAEPS